MATEFPKITMPAWVNVSRVEIRSNELLSCAVKCHYNLLVFLIKLLNLDWEKFESACYPLWSAHSCISKPVLLLKILLLKSFFRWKHNSTFCKLKKSVWIVREELLKVINQQIQSRQECVRYKLGLRAENLFCIFGWCVLFEKISSGQNWVRTQLSLWF